MIRLDGAVACVTGGARGIGKATAADLVRRGAIVWIGDLDLAEAERTAAEIGAHAAQLDELGVVQNAAATTEKLLIESGHAPVAALRTMRSVDALPTLPATARHAADGLGHRAPGVDRENDAIVALDAIFLGEQLDVARRGVPVDRAPVHAGLIFGERFIFAALAAELLLAEIDPDHDSLRFYALGAKGRAKVEHVGAKPVRDLDAAMVHVAWRDAAEAKVKAAGATVIGGAVPRLPGRAGPR